MAELTRASQESRETPYTEDRLIKLIVFFCVFNIFFLGAELAIYSAFLWIPALIYFHSSVKVVFAMAFMIQASFALPAMWYYARIIYEYRNRPDSPNSYYWAIRCLFTSHWIIIFFVGVTSVTGVGVYQAVLKERAIQIFPIWLAFAMLPVYALYYLYSACVYYVFRAESHLKHGGGTNRTSSYLRRQQHVNEAGENRSKQHITFC